MTAAVESELRKFFTTRMWWGMGIAVVLSGVAFAALNGFFLTSDAAAQAGVATLNDAELARGVYTGGLQVGLLLTLAIGVLTIGSEYRHKTISATFLAVPKRAKVLGAKVVALLGIGAGYGAVAWPPPSRSAPSFWPARAIRSGRTRPSGALWRSACSCSACGG